MITLKLVLIVVAVIFFACDFFRVTVATRTPSWTPGGFACLTVALLLLK